MKKFDFKNIDWKNIDKRRVFFLAIGVLCIGIAIYGLLDIFLDYKKSDDIYTQAEEEFVQVHVNTEEVLPEDRGPWYEYISVNIAGLQQINPEIVGWIYFEDGAISYPVLKGTDNEKYLNITYNGSYAKAGSIFMDASHSSDFSDTLTLIYGHNMKNLSMFSKLKYYKTQRNHYVGREYFQIHKGDEILRYQIFAFKDIPHDGFIYQGGFNSATQLAYQMLEGSYINPNLPIEDDDKIVVLSTCTSDDTRRFVVGAVLIERYSLTDKE